MERSHRDDQRDESLDDFSNHDSDIECGRIEEVGIEEEKSKQNELDPTVAEAVSLTIPWDMSDQDQADVAKSDYDDVPLGEENPFDSSRRSGGSSPRSVAEETGYASFPGHDERRGSVVEDHVPLCHQARRCCGTRTYVIMLVWSCVILVIMMISVRGGLYFERPRWEVAITCTPSSNATTDDDKPKCIDCVGTNITICRDLIAKQYKRMPKNNNADCPWSGMMRVTECFLERDPISPREKRTFNGDNYCSCGTNNDAGCKRYIRVNEPVPYTLAAYVVLNVLVLSVLLVVVDKFPSEIVRFGVAAACACVGIITPGDIFYAFGTPSIITLALMCILCTCLFHTFQLEQLTLLYMRTRLPESLRVLCSTRFLRPRHLSMASDESDSYSGRCGQLLKMALFVFPLRLALPYNDVLLPCVLPWSRKLRMSESNVLLCMSVFASFAACMTPLGGAVNIILASRDPRLGFFSPATSFFTFMPTAVLCNVVGILYFACVMSVVPPLDPFRPHAAAGPRAKSYRFTLQVSDRFAYLHQSLDNTGLLNVPGARLLRIYSIGQHPRFGQHQSVLIRPRNVNPQATDGDQSDSSGTPKSLEDVTDGMLHPLSSIPAHPASVGRHSGAPSYNSATVPLLALTLGSSPRSANPSSHVAISSRETSPPDAYDDTEPDELGGYEGEIDGSWVLEEGDWIVVEATAHAIARLRLMEGLELDPIIRSNVQILGSKRGRRVLLEAVLSPMSEMVGADFPKGITRFTMAQRAALLAVRRPSCVQSNNGGGLSRGKFRAGDIVLMEAFNEFERSAVCSCNFDLVRVIEGSNPPRHGTTMDRIRCLLAVCSVCSIFAFSAYGCPLAMQALIWGVVLFAAKVAPLETAVRRFPIGHLLEIVFACAVSIAVRECGLSNLFGHALVWTGGDSGGTQYPVCILASFYMLSLFLCLLMSNLTACILLMPVLSEVSIMSNVRGEILVTVLLCSTHFSFVTNTNIRNSFLTKHDLLDDSNFLVSRDILRVAGPLQFVMLIVTVLSLYTVHGGKITY